MIGDAVVYGNLVCKPSQLTEFKEIEFFKILEETLQKPDFEQYRKIALKKSNLKKGITIGNMFFIIERKKESCTC